jgi:hypothetical protein
MKNKTNCGRFLTNVVATDSGNSNAITVNDAVTNAASPTASIPLTIRQVIMNAVRPSI